MSAGVFMLGATTAALVGGALLLPGSARADSLASSWAATGFVAMAFVLLQLYERFHSRIDVDPASLWGRLFPRIARGSLPASQVRRGIVAFSLGNRPLSPVWIDRIAGVPDGKLRSARSLLRR
jgi:hypothetical protein